jgi:hypothetical protein
MQPFADTRGVDCLRGKHCTDTAEPAQCLFANGIYVAHFSYIHD